MDQSSTDNTVRICREYTNRVFIVPPKGFCEPDRPVAASKATNDWILYIDADEEISTELREEIESTLSQTPEYDSYRIPRKNIFLGKWIKGSGWYPGYVLRLFKKGSVKFPEDIHKNILPIGSCGYLQKDIIHITCENLGEYLQKVSRYTTVAARQMYFKGERVTCKNFILKLLILPLVRFFQKFFLMSGFRDGFYGFLIAFLTFLTVFMMHIKLWDTQRNNA